MIKYAFACTLALALVLTASACSAPSVDDGSVKMPSSSDDFDGQQFQEVVDSLEGAGFTDIETVPLGNLITGWLNGEGEVDSVDVAGTTEFSTNKSFPADIKIVVSYHSFPLDEDEEAPTPETSESAEPEPVENAKAETLTIENSADLAAILALGDYCDASIDAFAVANAGRTIMFDGNIGALNSHENAKTRFDILVGAGDHSTTSARGPAFQFRDINIVYDLMLSDNAPEYVNPGDNIRVTAEVLKYEPSSCLFLLEPVLTEYR